MIKFFFRHLGLIIALLMGVFGAMPAYSEVLRVEHSERESFRVVQLADGLDHPWSLAFLPRGGILITERPGKLRLFQDGVLQRRAIPGLPRIHSLGQGGLLDVVLHPGFNENGWVYFSYVSGIPLKVSTHVARAVFDGFGLKRVEVIFSSSPLLTRPIHFGSRLLFGNDGFLYITLGERGRMEEAQNLGNHLGTIVRLHPDGRVPSDNPFVGRLNAKAEIFSYGHRNVQGITEHPVTKVIWTHEHGPKGGDEVNVLKAGSNYGWPTITYGIDYDGSIISENTAASGLAQPVLHWTPSIAPCGMTFYDGDKFPHWNGNLFVGALARRHLRRVVLNGERVVAQEELLGGLGERIRDVRQGPDGFLYVLTDSSNGKLLRLEPI